MKLLLLALILLFLGCTETITPIEDDPDFKEYINLSGNQSNDWSFLEGEKAREVMLTGSSIDSAGLHWVAQIEGMEKLILDDCDNITSFEALIGLDIVYLDVDSCDSVTSFPFGTLEKLEHLEAGYCWEVSKNNYTAFKFVDSLPELKYLGIGFMGYCSDSANHLPLIDTIAGGSVNDSTYYKDNGVVYINEHNDAQKWYEDKSDN
jgi:hypothetical protein